MRSFLAATFALCFALTSPADEQPLRPQPGTKLATVDTDTKFNKVVKVEFPKDGNTFTLAAAAKGVQVKYKIVVEEDLKVIPLLNPPSYVEPAGASGLHPFEQLSGNGQAYFIGDAGLGRPPKEMVLNLKKGTYEHSFEWDGRNWSGPSDTSNPKGKAFPAGTYDVTVVVHGKLVDGKEQTPYRLTAKGKLILKE